MKKIIAVMLFFVLISNSFTAIFSNSVSALDTEDFWSIKTSMKQERLDAGVVAMDGKIYVIGGCYMDGCIVKTVDTNECYDPVSDTWITLKSMPTPRTDFATIAYQDKIYCIGNGPTEVYDIATDSWSTKASISITGWFWDMQAYIVDGTFFVLVPEFVPSRNSFGSVGGSRSIIHVYMYDQINDSWTAKSSMPFPLTDSFRFVSAMLDEKILIFGSFYMDTAYTVEEGKVVVYNPKTDVWTEKSTIPEDIFSTSPDILGVTSGIYAPQRVYMLFGANTYAYDPIEDAWSTAKSPPKPQDTYNTGVVIDDVMYIMGMSGNSFWSPERVDRVFMQYAPIGYSGSVSFENSSTLKEFFNDPFMMLILCLTVIIIIMSIVYVIIQRKIHKEKKTKTETTL